MPFCRIYVFKFDKNANFHPHMIRIYYIHYVILHGDWFGDYRGLHFLCGYFGSRTFLFKNIILGERITMKHLFKSVTAIFLCIMIVFTMLLTSCNSKGNDSGNNENKEEQTQAEDASKKESDYKESSDNNGSENSNGGNNNGESTDKGNSEGGNSGNVDNGNSGNENEEGGSSGNESITGNYA